MQIILENGLLWAWGNLDKSEQTRCNIFGRQIEQAANVFPGYKISSRIDMNDSGSGRIRWIWTKFDHKKIFHV